LLMAQRAVAVFLNRDGVLNEAIRCYG